MPNTRLIAGTLDVVAWVSTREGDIFGPVSATSVKVAAPVAGYNFALIWQFDYPTPTKTVTIDELTIQIYETVRRQPLELEIVRPGDLLTVYYTMHCHFDESVAQLPALANHNRLRNSKSTQSDRPPLRRVIADWLLRPIQ